MRACVGKEMSVIFMLHILGADALLPWIGIAAEGLGRRPRHGEDARVLYRKFKLQAFAVVVRINRASGRPPFLREPRQPCLGGLVADETIALDHVQGFRIRRSEE